jgi:hypothetical protein
MSEQPFNTPDFIIIGAMKCATTTLHRQLESQPGFFCTTPKEPNFFSNDDVYSKGEKWYSNLYSDAKPNDTKGESSTHYTKLPTYPHTIDRMKSYGIEAPKLIYMVRHPIDRLISHYQHQWTMREITEDINIAIDKYPELIAYSSYYTQLKPYLEWQKGNSVLLCFFDSVYTQPQAMLEQACQYLDYSGEPKWNDDSGEENSSKMRWRKFPLSDVLVESNFMTAIRRAIVPQSLRSKIKSKLSMNEKPILSEESLTKLQNIFDRELGELGKLIGSDLSCDNFKSFAKSTASVVIQNS